MLNQRAVGVFVNYRTTELALQELKNRGFLMDQVSVIGRDIDGQIENVGVNTSSRLAAVEDLNFNEHKAEEAAKAGAVTGGTLGGVTGLLVGLGTIAIPGVGPVIMAGAAATAIATALSGGVIGAAAGSLGGGLVGLGVPEDRAKVYSNRVEKGDYLVIVEGAADDITLAHTIFSKHGIYDWYVSDLSDRSERIATPVSTHSRLG